MLTIVFPIIAIIGCCFSFSFIAKKRFEEILPLTIMSMTLVTYLIGLFTSFKVAYVIILLFALFGVISFIASCIKNRCKLTSVSIFERYITPGFICFLMLCAVLVIIDNNRHFSLHWDQFAHWGPMIKEMFRLDKFYCVPESALSSHRDYPPIVTLFETLFCRFSMGYSEEKTFFALHILCFSMLFPALSKHNWGKNGILPIIKNVLLIGVMMTVMLILYLGEGYFYSTIYIDCALSIISAYCIFSAFTEKKLDAFCYIKLTISFCFLILIKQVAIAFFLLALGVFIANLIISSYKKKKISVCVNKEFSAKFKLKHIALILMLLVIPFLISKTWTYYISQYNIGSQFNSSSINLKEFITVVNGSSDQLYKIETFKNFINNFLTANYIVKPIPLTYWQLILLSIILFYCIGHYGKKHYSKANTVSLNFLISIGGSLCYAFLMMLLYVFCFNSYEAPHLASISRYMGSYWFMTIILLCMLFLDINLSKDNDSKKIDFKHIAAVLLAICILFVRSDTIVDQFALNRTKSADVCFSDDVEIIKKTVSEDDKIYIINQAKSEMECYQIKYLMLPQRFNSWISSFGDQSYDTKVYTIDEVKNLLSGYDYVYLYAVNDNFVNRYSSLFENQNIQTRHLYKIEQSDDLFQLKIVQ